MDWTGPSGIAGAIDVPGQAIIDGEVVVVHEGRTNFSELQAELASGRQGRLFYYAFEVLWRDGDLRRLPQIERKQALLDLIGENGVEMPVLYSEHLTGDGQEMFEHAAKLGWEGIISKRADWPLPTPIGEGVGLARTRSCDDEQGRHRRSSGGPVFQRAQISMRTSGKTSSCGRAG